MKKEYLETYRATVAFTIDVSADTIEQASDRVRELFREAYLLSNVYDTSIRGQEDAWVVDLKEHGTTYLSSGFEAGSEEIQSRKEGVLVGVKNETTFERDGKQVKRVVERKDTF